MQTRYFPLVKETATEPTCVMPFGLSVKTQAESFTLGILRN